MKKILFLLIISVLIVSGCSLASNKNKQTVLSPEEAKAKAEEYINTNLMNSGRTATVKEITEEGGIYKLVVDVGGQDIDSYLTLDGKIFFPQALKIDEATNNNTQDNSSNNKQAATTNVTKSDKPVVEAFVMSHCPYGTQIEKGLIPVVETLGDKIDFQIKFVDYSMHGEKEVYEELNQYCINQEHPDKYLEYLKCFLEAGDTDGCLTKTGIDSSSLKACIDSTDKEYKITELFKDQSTWSGGRYPQFNIYKTENDKYGVSGSPTLVINGGQVSSARDSASLLSLICSAFNTQPDECNTQLSSAAPSAGFGFDASGSDTSATCN